VPVHTGHPLRGLAFERELDKCVQRNVFGRDVIRVLNTNIFLVVLVVVIAVWAKGQTPPPAIFPQPADNTPLEWKVTAVDGSEIDLAKLRGKVVLLDFWATRCPACVEELPNLLATYNKFHDKGLEIIGISSDENKEILLRFVKTRGITWPQYLDDYTQISQHWKINGLPSMWLINKKGLVANKDARADLEGKVAKLLAE
jgi:peroxiredoxin